MLKPHRLQNRVQTQNRKSPINVLNVINAAVTKMKDTQTHIASNKDQTGTTLTRLSVHSWSEAL